MQPCYAPPYSHPQPCNCHHNKASLDRSESVSFQLEASGLDSPAITPLEGVQAVTSPLQRLLSLVETFISESYVGWEHSGPRGKHLQ